MNIHPHSGRGRDGNSPEVFFLRAVTGADPDNLDFHPPRSSDVIHRTRDTVARKIEPQIVPGVDAADFEG